jgi:hypothetical protein
MNRQIDFKSFIIGILVTVCIVMAMGASRFSGSGSDGRFQLNVRDNHAYIIDTANGRVWERFAPASQGRTSKNFHAEKISPDATDQD